MAKKKKQPNPRTRGLKPGAKIDTSPKGSSGVKSDFHSKRVRVGRRSDYRESYCEEIIKFCGQGYSFEAFAGHIGTTSDTLRDWTLKHPDFSAAKSRAREANRKFWEKTTIANSSKNTGNAAGIRFNLINRFRGEWTDSHSVDITSAGKQLNNSPSIDVSKLSEATLRRVLEELKQAEADSDQS